MLILSESANAWRGGVLIVALRKRSEFPPRSNAPTSRIRSGTMRDVTAFSNVRYRNRRRRFLKFRREFAAFQQHARCEPVEITRHGWRVFVLPSAEHYDWIRAPARRTLRCRPCHHRRGGAGGNGLRTHCTRQTVEVPPFNRA